jgi:ATP-dependent DNA helicase DinG
LTKREIYEIFDKGGLLEEHFPAYEYREGQLEMAEVVRQSFEEDAIAVLEAGTGIGKSFAYLAVAAQRAANGEDERTVIATSTINLQRQLYEKDLPILLSSLSLNCKTALAVGRSNYVCILRFLQVKGDSAVLAADPNSELYRVDQWIKRTETGLFAELSPSISAELFSEICCDVDLCPAHSCPYFKECFFFKAKARAREAAIVITNHHLLFSDAQNRLLDSLQYSEEAILPPFDRLVIDEAHNIESNASEYFSSEYDSSSLLRQVHKIQRIGRYNKNSLLDQLAEYCKDIVIIEAVRDAIHLLIGHVETLDQYLISVFAKNDYQPVLIKAEHQSRLSEFVPAAQQVVRASTMLSTAVLRFIEALKAPTELEGRVTEIRVRSERIDAMAQVLDRFCDFASWGDEVHWFNAENTRSRIRIQVRITPLSIAPLLVQALFSKLATVVCTSATLDLGDDFAFWSQRVGLPYTDERPFYRGIFSSPFDYQSRLMLLTPVDAPLPPPRADEAYLSYLTETVFESVHTAGGGALVLFTSFAVLKAVHQNLAPRFAEEGMTLLSQGEADRYTLLTAFKEEEDSTLFATSSFWEGVDAPGETLRLVIIAKLPFSVPSDPVFKARCEAIDRAGGSGFYQLSLQSATMKLKQGFGRLLRSSADRGIVLILDSRVVLKNYGLYMLKSLPQSYHPECETASISSRIESFLF